MEYIDGGCIELVVFSAGAVAAGWYLGFSIKEEMMLYFEVILQSIAILTGFLEIYNKKNMIMY